MADWKPNGAAAPTDTPAQPAPEPQPESAPQPDPAGTELVDFKNAPPDQVEARFRRIYANMKENERAVTELAQINQKLSQRLDSMQTGLVKEKVEDVLGALRTEKIAALEKADYAKVALIDEQIVKAVAKASQLERPAAPAPQPQPAAPAGGLTRDEVHEVAGWASAVDRNGNFLRPWALPNHPNHQNTVAQISQIAQDPRFANAPIGEVLAEMDKRMRPQGGFLPGQPPVLPTGGARPPASKFPQLSDQERRVAERMFLNSGVVKSAADAHKRYAEQKAL